MSMALWTTLIEYLASEGDRACLEAASVSMAVAGCRKWVTSAMCTPSSRVPLGRGRMCRASSMSLHPGGSTLQMGRCRRSSLHMHTGVDALRMQLRQSCRTLYLVP